MPGNIADWKGITAMSLFSELRSEAIKTLPPKPCWAYNVLWEGSSEAVSAYFATPILGCVTPNFEEEQTRRAFFDPVHPTFSPFGVVVVDAPRRASIGIYDFNLEDYSIYDLTTFSFLSADNLPMNKNMVAGIVHYDGYMSVKIERLCQLCFAVLGTYHSIAL